MTWFLLPSTATVNALVATSADGISAPSGHGGAHLRHEDDERSPNPINDTLKRCGRDRPVKALDVDIPMASRFMRFTRSARLGS